LRPSVLFGSNNKYKSWEMKKGVIKISAFFIHGKVPVPARE
jgi:hypothetical protein